MAWGNPVAPAASAEPSVVHEGVSYVIGSPEYIAKRDQLGRDWQNEVTVLSEAKEREMRLRKEVAAFNFPTPTKGTQRIDLDAGYKLKLVHKETANIVVSNEAVDEAEDAAREIGNEGQFLFERIISWSPKFSESEFKKLDTQFEVHRKVKQLVESIIERKVASPILEIEAPKK